MSLGLLWNEFEIAVGPKITNIWGFKKIGHPEYRLPNSGIPLVITRTPKVPLVSEASFLPQEAWIVTWPGLVLGFFGFKV